MRNTIDSLPSWGKFAAVVGLPGAMCFLLIYLLFFSMGDVSAQTQSMVSQLHYHESQRLLSQVTVEKMLNDHQEHLDKDSYILSLICQSVAKTEQVKLACIKGK